MSWGERGGTIQSLTLRKLILDLMLDSSIPQFNLVMKLYLQRTYSNKQTKNNNNKNRKKRMKQTKTHRTEKNKTNVIYILGMN